MDSLSPWPPTYHYTRVENIVDRPAPLLYTVPLLLNGGSFSKASAPPLFFGDENFFQKSATLVRWGIRLVVVCRGLNLPGTCPDFYHATTSVPQQQGAHETWSMVFPFKSLLSEKTQRVVCRFRWFLLYISSYRRQTTPQYGLSWSACLRIHRTGDDS